MDRVTGFGYSELIGAGYNLLPNNVKSKLEGVHFFTGVSPIYAGLFEDSKTFDGRSYNDCWCYVDRLNTIVMPNLHKHYPFYLRPLLIVHELGHALDMMLDYRCTFTPVTEYAESNREESFAESFTLWCCPHYREYYSIINELSDEATYLFESLDNR